VRVKDQDKSNCDLVYMALFGRESLGLDQKKTLKESSWFGKPKCKLGSKVGHVFV
jgi:hypothetical protein